MTPPAARKSSGSWHLRFRTRTRGRSTGHRYVCTLIGFLYLPAFCRDLPNFSPTCSPVNQIAGFGRNVVFVGSGDGGAGVVRVLARYDFFRGTDGRRKTPDGDPRGEALPRVAYNGNRRTVAERNMRVPEGRFL